MEETEQKDIGIKIGAGWQKKNSVIIVLNKDIRITMIPNRRKKEERQPDFIVLKYVPPAEIDAVNETFQFKMEKLSKTDYFKELQEMKKNE